MLPVCLWAKTGEARRSPKKIKTPAFFPFMCCPPFLVWSRVLIIHRFLNTPGREII
jgi:hypothetical protein